MSLINDALKRASQVHKERPAAPQETARLQPAQHRPPVNVGAWLVGCVVTVLCLCGILFLWSGFRGSSTPNAQSSLQNPPPAQAPSSAAPPPSQTVLAQSSLPTQTPSQHPPTGSQQSPTPAQAVTQASAPNTSVSTPQPAVKPTPEIPAASIPAIGTPQSAVPLAVAPPITPANPPPPSSTVAASPTQASSPNAATTAKSTDKPKNDIKPTSTTVSPASFPELKLQGIYFRMSNPSVLINGHNLHVGDAISGVRVVKIERQSVTVEMAGQKKVLVLR
ncbi:MAG TPA: hypothetical protein P5186_17645 [Candidatus Paceibacterota bacterium]|nr:hypothetical protein [Verrucomicrobiota bacterium]HRY49876.1 hypothetical protein [Candidatus Paceibacterota bacterium]HSA02270.1 hypothetical protein [Candidatus Paceibacterota bacterium]